MNLSIVRNLNKDYGEFNKVLPCDKKQTICIRSCTSWPVLQHLQECFSAQELVGYEGEYAYLQASHVCNTSFYKKEMVQKYSVVWVNKMIRKIVSVWNG